MSKVNEILRAFIEETRTAYETAGKEFNEVLDNPGHTQSELIHAAAQFHEKQGEYNAAMQAWLRLYETGAI